MDNQILLMVTMFIAVLAVVLAMDKTSASKNHIFDIQCEIGGQIKTYQVEKFRQERGVIHFKIDDKTVKCSQFFIQEIAK